MNFHLNLKDIIYLCTNVITIACIIFAMRAKIAALEKEFTRQTQIVYGDKGKLNLIDVGTCKEHRDQVFRAIRRGEDVMEQAIRKMEDLNKNVLTIMVYLQIKPPGNLPDIKILDNTDKNSIDG